MSSPGAQRTSATPLYLLGVMTEHVSALSEQQECFDINTRQDFFWSLFMETCDEPAWPPSHSPFHLTATPLVILCPESVVLLVVALALGKPISSFHTKEVLPPFYLDTHKHTMIKTLQMEPLGLWGSRVHVADNPSVIVWPFSTCMRHNYMDSSTEREQNSRGLLRSTEGGLFFLSHLLPSRPVSVKICTTPTFLFCNFLH